MKKMKITLFILLSISLSCAAPHSSEFQFDEKKNLEGKPVLIEDTVYFRYPFRIREKDSLLYILDLHGPDFYCHTFKYPGMSLENSYAHKGNGPEEFLRVENIRLNKHGAIYLLDANNMSISIYKSFTDSLFKRINLSEKLIRSLDFTLIDDSLYAIPDYSGKYRVNIINNNGNITKQLFIIPTKKRRDPNIPDIALAQAWRPFLDYNPDNGILAMVTQLGQVIEIYNLKTNEIINILYGKFGEPEFANQGAYAVPTGIMGYSDVHVGRDKIYTLFWGTSFKNIRKEDPHNRIEGGNTIQVFSLKGTPLLEYSLDKYITGFCIDEKKNTLLGLDVNNEHHLIEYQLSILR